MSPDVASPVAIVSRSYESFARDDMDGVLADMHPDIEWHQAQVLPHGGFYRGLDEVRRNIFDPLDRDWWAEFTVEPQEFIESADQVVVLGRYRGVQGHRRMSKARRRRSDRGAGAHPRRAALRGRDHVLCAGK